MIDAATRLQGVEELINRKQYFVIHAARQSGKTTYLRDLAQRLNAGGKYYVLYCSLESVQGVIDPEKGIPEVVEKLKTLLRFSNIPHKTEFAVNANYRNFTGVLNSFAHQLRRNGFCVVRMKDFYNHFIGNSVN
jgi:AAA+ ATPase superfamily predicted ATPase